MILLIFIFYFLPIFQCVSFGRHFPNGYSAVQYIYSEEGMYKNMGPLYYFWNYYSQYETISKPFNRDALISFANGDRAHTCRDANGFLLCDTNRDLELDQENCGYAFHEHNGRGANGAVANWPFTQFWFDDNWLARYMSVAYGTPHPSGLQDQPGFIRWRVLSGDTSYYTPYNLDLFDCLALDGMYYLALGNLNSALNNWDRITEKSLVVYNEEFQQFIYIGFQEIYHMGLCKILADFLIERPDISAARRSNLIQHSVAMRSYLLWYQQTKDGFLIGWTTGFDTSKHLINTETISVSVLALGATALDSLEILIYEEASNFHRRPYNVLSAVAGESTAGLMNFGPWTQYNLGTHTVEYYLRAPVFNSDPIGVIYILDYTTNSVVAQDNINSANMNTGNAWTILSLNFWATPGHIYEFRCYWYGQLNLDLAYIRVKN